MKRIINELWTYPGVRLAVPMDTFVFYSAERTASIERCFSVSATRSAKREQTNLKLISFVFNTRDNLMYYTLWTPNSKRFWVLNFAPKKFSNEVVYKSFSSINSLHLHTVYHYKLWTTSYPSMYRPTYRIVWNCKMIR